MKNGFTIIEMLIVILIFTFLLGTIFTILTTSDRSWRVGQGKLIEQQEARKAMDSITGLLRESKPVWVNITSEFYVACNKNFDMLYFNEPVFNESTGQMEPGPWVVFRMNPNNCEQLRKRSKSDSDWIAVASRIEDIKFFGGDCAGCSCNFSNPGCLNCKNVTDTCPVIKIEVKTKKENEFSLVSSVTLRNAGVNSTATPESPPQEIFQEISQ